MRDHADAIVYAGTTLGKTLRASQAGIAPHENRIVAYTAVEADNHQGTAELFRDHPHFSFMPGDSVQIVKCLSSGR